MTNKKVTKRALLASVLALVLCVSMLVGSTYAWFTDSVSSVNNVIKSGNLDVELYYQNDANADWTAVDANTNVFKTETLWEPGHVEVIKLQVANVGTLALKYQLGVNVVSETGSKNVYGEEFKLSDYIYFGIVEGAQDYSREEAVAAVESGAVKLNAGLTKASELLSGKDEAVTLVVYMPESVGNEANYAKGEAVPEINLGIDLYATQYTYEEDSFGNDYDADAMFGTYLELEAGADLLAALQGAEAGRPLVIKLNGNVEWPTNGHNGFDNVTDASSVVIDGQGKYSITAVGSGVTALGDTDAPFTLKNMTVVDNSVSYEEDSWEFGYLEIGGVDFVCENVTFTDPVMVEGSKSTFNNCSFVGYTDEGVDDGKNYSMTMYGVWAISGTQNYNGCTFTGTRGMKVCDSNTSNSYASSDVNVTVDGCTFDNLTQKPGVAIDYSGDADIAFAVTIKNSMFINCQAGDQNLYVYETDNYVPVVSNNTVESYSELVEIGTKEELYAFAERVNGGDGMSKVLVKLTADIDLAGMEWTPVGQTGTSYGAKGYFKGIFDGQGHTISNMTISNTNAGANYAAGFFGFIDAADATIKDVNFDKANVCGHHWTGVVAGYLTGTVDNCHVTNSTVSCTHANDDACGDKAGAVVGYINKGFVNNCSASDTTVSAGRDAGQIVGAAKTTQVTNCTAENVAVSATGDCTGKNIANDIIGRKL